MPRRRSAPPRRSAPAPKPQARSYSSAPPPPARTPSAPPPAQQTGGGGGILSGLAGTVMQGAALGTGSALAHRAVDSMFSSGSPPPEPAQAMQATQQMQSGAEVCANQAKAFTDCMTSMNGEMAACQFYFDQLQQCKLSN